MIGCPLLIDCQDKFYSKGEEVKRFSNWCLIHYTFIININRLFYKQSTKEELNDAAYSNLFEDWGVSGMRKGINILW